MTLLELCAVINTACNIGNLILRKRVNSQKSGRKLENSKKADSVSSKNDKIDQKMTKKANTAPKADSAYKNRKLSQDESSD